MLMWEVSQKEVTNITSQILYAFLIMEKLLYSLWRRGWKFLTCQYVGASAGYWMWNYTANIISKFVPKSKISTGFVLWNVKLHTYTILSMRDFLDFHHCFNSEKHFESWICFHPQVRGCKVCSWVQSDRRSCSQLLDNLVYVPSSKYARETEVAKSL